MYSSIQKVSSLFQVKSDLIAVAINVFTLFLLAQIHFYIPFTEIPVTGQSFGVILISFLFPLKTVFTSIGLYLSIGFLGLPVFAGMNAGVKLISLGYLIGMLVAGPIVSILKLRLPKNSFLIGFLLSMIGHGIIFVFGVLYLRWIIHIENPIQLGLVPFIPGLLVKSILLASIFKIKKNSII